MSSDRLRAAAKTLRQRAEAATPGPWRIKTYYDGAGWASDDLTLYARHGYLVRPGNHGGMFNDPEDPLYIATVHPGVGLVLADWLDEIARDFEIARYGYWSVRATEIADLILGGEES